MHTTSMLAAVRRFVKVVPSGGKSRCQSGPTQYCGAMVLDNVENDALSLRFI